MFAATRRRSPRAAIVTAVAATAAAALAFPVPGTFGAESGNGRAVAIGAVADHGGPGETGGPVAGVATAPGGGGYWVALADGGVHTFGDADFHGSAVPHHPPHPTVDITSVPKGNGYWLVTAAGHVFSFGDARYHGGLDRPMNQPVVAIVPSRSGNGYWLATADGGVFSFGDARFAGSAAGGQRRAPIVDAAADPSGDGYWLLAGDGGVFAFGDAGFAGSAAEAPLPAPAVAIAAAPDGGGYWITLGNGQVQVYGTARDHGSAAGLPAPVVDLAAHPRGEGYWLLTGQRPKVRAQHTGRAVEYRATSGRPGEPPDSQFDRLAQCESGGRWNINSGNGYYGGLQFSLRTWRGLGGPGMPHEQSRETQIDIARKQWRQSGWRAWPSCSRQLGWR